MASNNNEIKFRVGFETETTSLQKLKTSLSEIQKMTASEYMSLHKGMDLATAQSELLEVKKSVNQVQLALKNSFNADLGTTNVTKFNEQLKSMNISKIAADFQNAGAAGQVAFRNVTSQVLTTNLQLKETHKFLDSIATTMGNTIKWGVASHIMNGFTESVQKAYSYVKNLDESLTNIRIVSGQSAEQMAKFAQNANTAAAALGATTTQYTDAALIYYQQGLSDEEVLSRTNATIKMANVLGESANQVSDYMTAIWNNFKSGSLTMEEYGDIITALGASTASSSEEIAQGLEKFASAAEASGLSYEYATSALATVVATTRQSADTVGTAFKTIFARIQGLNLGETLDDGTTLNKYSEALAKVGISIKDQNGELKKMDDILDEMGSKWQTLNKDEQLALAQTVAGTRQYNQLIALMDNWDFMTENLETAANATGTLNEQQETYMNSMQAHLNQLKAAQQDLYSAFFDTDSFKELIDIFTILTTGVANFVKGIGGGGTALLSLGSIATTVFSKQIAQGIATTITNFQNAKYNANQLAAQMEILKTYKDFNLGGESIQTLVNMKQQVLDLGNLVSQEQMQEADAIINETAELQNQQDQWDESLKKASEYTAQVMQLDSIDIKGIGDGTDYDNVSKALTNVVKSSSQAEKEIGNYKKQLEATRNATIKAGNATENKAELEEKAIAKERELKDTLSMAEAEIQSVIQEDAASAEQKQILINAINEYNQALANGVDPSEAGQNLLAVYEQVNSEIRAAAEETLNTIQQESEGTSQRIVSSLEQSKQRWKSFLKGLNTQKLVQGFTQLLGGIGQVTAGIQSLVNITKIWNDEDLSTGEKTLQIISALAMGLPMVISGFSSVVTGGKAIIGVIKGSIIPAFTEMGVASWASLGPYALVVAAVIAALALLTVGIYSAVKAFNADAEAAKEAAEQVETLSKRYEELKSKAEDLKKAISDYSDAKKELKDLKVGTDEYKEALEEANKKARDLIETYGLFDKWHMENGVIVIDDDALEEAEQKAENAADKAQSNLAAAKIISNQANLKSQTTNIGRKIGAVVETGEYTDSTVPREVMRNFTNKELQEAADAINELTEANNGVALSDDQLKEKMLAMGDELSPAVKEHIDAIVRNRTSLETLADSMDDARKANEYYAKQVIGMAIKDEYGDRIDAMATDDKGVTNEALVNQITTAATEAAAKKDAENETSLQKQLKGVKGTASSNDDLVKKLKALGIDYGLTYSKNDDDDLAMAYAKYVLGYENTENFTYESGWNNGTVKDEKGKKIIDKVSDDVMRHALHRQAQIDQITAQFTESIGDTGGDLIGALEKMQKGADKFGDQFEADFTNAILTSMAEGDFTKLDLSSLFNDLDPNEVAQLVGMDQATLLSSLGLTEDDIKALGYADATAFYNAWQDGLNQYDAIGYWENQLQETKQRVGEIGDALDALSADKLTKKQLESMQETLADLEQKYPELAEIQQQGSHEYLELLRQIQEQEETNAMIALEGIKNEAVARKEQLESEIQDLKDELNEAGREGRYSDIAAIQMQIDAKTDEFDEVIAEIEGADYSIKMQIEADLASDVDQAFGLADEIDNLSEYITDSFQMTYDEAQAAIEAGYGAMLQNAQESADGIIQLDEGVVNAFIDGKQAELEADKQSKITQLENQKAMLQTQLQTLQAKQQALSNAREANTKGDKQAALAEAMMLEAQYQAQLEAMNAELAADAEQKSKLAGKSEELYNVLSGMYETDSQNEQNATDASDKTAALHGKNVVAYYNNMQQAVVAYSNAVAAAESGGASYNEVPWNNGAGGTDTVSAGQTAVQNAYDSSYEAIESTIEDLTSNMSLDEIDAAIDQMNQDTQAQIDSINNQIGAIDAGIAALNSASDKLDYKQSHGGKTPKEASKDSKDDKKEKDPDQMDPFTDKDVDVFREVDQEINKISKDLSSLQREEKRLTGKELLDNLNKQLKVLNSQRDAYAAKIKLAQQEADMLRNSLSNQGVAFNNDGTVANYQQALEAKQKYINDLIEQYNGMSADEQKEFKETVENAKKDYESFKKSMDEYDKYLLDVIPELKEKIEETLEKEIEIQITKFNMAVEIRLDLTKAEKDWNEFNRRVIKGLNKDTDKGYLTGTLEETLANMGSYYNAQRTGQIQIGTDQVNKILDEIAIMNAGGHSDVYSAYDAETDTWVDNKAKALEDLKKNYEQLMQDLEQMEDYADAVDEAFLKSIDNVAAAFEQKSKILDFYSKQIDHDLKMTKLLYGDKAYDKIGERQERQLEHLEKQKDLIQEQTNYWKRLMDAAREAGDNEAYKKYRDNWMDSIDELNGKIEEWAELTKEKYANTVQEIIDNLNKEVTGGLGLDQVGEEWELINKNANNYLDIINRAFALQSLENKWQDAINKTDSVSAQKKLNELMSEQMDMLREKDTLTQYDIDRANMEYEIALKQIALEEAQQNKSTMKLKRDANGNYSYQFVSDEDSILQAQQDLAEAQNKLYNFDKDAYQQNLDEIYSIWSEFQQKVADAYTEFADDQEALSEYIALLQEQYGEKINFLTEQNLSIRENLQESAFTELANMYETDVTNFQGMSDDEKDIIMNSLLPQWDSGVQHMTDKFIGDGGFVPACEDAFSQLGEAANDYREKTEEIGQMADEVSQQVESEHRILEHEAQNAIDAAEEEKQRIGEIREEVQGLIEDYKEARNAAIQAANAAYAYWTQEQKNSIAAVINDLNNPGGGDSGSGNGSGGGSGSGSSGGGDGKLSVGDTATFTGQYYYDSYGLTPIGSKYSGVANGVVIDNVNNNPYGIHIHSADGKYGDLGWVKKSQLSGYDTGGYTGEWDSSGRLALLHQKELVLNAHDTENMLNIVGMVRDLTDSLNNSMLSRAFGLMESIATNLTSVREVGSDTLEQDVHIEATFPNVHESREIENALNNLVNRASQFANRKQR